MSNLPPGTTPGDIDRHYGEPAKARVMGTVMVAADAVVPENASDRERIAALMDAVRDGEGEVIDAEIEETERV